MRRWPARLRLWLAAIAVALTAACTSPTLPLPPPMLPSVTVGSEPGTYRLRSERGALPNALVVAVNRNATLAPQERVAGTFADEQGSWELLVVGHAGDVLDLSQEDGATRSPTIAVSLE